MGVKQSGMSKTEVAALVQDGLEDEGSEPIDLPPSQPAVPAPAVMPPPPPQAAVDVQSLVQMLAAAMQQNGASTAQAIKEGLSEATTMAREPIPENKQDPGISVYSHPDGDLKHPRTSLRCQMFLGIYDDEGKVVPAFEYINTTEKERLGLNRLTTGTFRIERNDGIEGLVRVQEKLDDLGAPIRLTVAVPLTWLQKEGFQQMPSLKRMLDQMLTADSAAA